MALGVDAVVVRTPFEEFTVRVERGRARPEGEQLELARWAASQFRFGVEMGDPGVVRAARELNGRPASIHFVELVLRDSDDEPVVNEPIGVTDSGGKEHQVTSDAQGRVHVEGLSAGEITVKLVDRDGSDWSIEGPPSL